MTALLTPVNRSEARTSGASRLWRKQILPIGEIEYKGRKIPFTREYLGGLVSAFAARAYDQVPFQLADAPNSHTNDPERFRGEIRGFELADDGLDLILAATEDGDAVLRENPSLGVSARIVEDYHRADGKFFPAAIQHVLGTLDPRITGMRPWQAIEAANDAGDVIDLTDAEYTPPEPQAPPAPREKHAKPEPATDPTTQPEPEDPAAPTAEEHDMALTPDQEARLGRLLDLPDDKFEALLADAPAEEELLSDAELDALLAGLPGDAVATEPAGETEPEGEPVLTGAALSAEAQAAIDLANDRAEQQGLELARITQALDRATYEKERDAMAREHGIPPRITDLARPLLEGTGRVVELANGSAIDAGQIVRKVLAEIGKTVKMLDLTGEIGTPLDFGREAEEAAAADEKAQRAAVVAGFRQMTGV